MIFYLHVLLLLSNLVKIIVASRTLLLTCRTTINLLTRHLVLILPLIARQIFSYQDDKVEFGARKLEAVIQIVKNRLLRKLIGTWATI